MSEHYMSEEQSLAGRIRAARKKHRISQEELAEMCDVSRQTVSMWECGNKRPSSTNLKNLEQLLGFSAAEPSKYERQESQQLTLNGNSFSNSGCITGHNIGNVTIPPRPSESRIPAWIEELFVRRRTNPGIFKLFAQDMPEAELRALIESVLGGGL